MRFPPTAFHPPSDSEGPGVATRRKKVRQIPPGAVSMDMEAPAESAAGAEPKRKDYAFDGHGGSG